jgi:lipid II:glycine glycyltransferase (peptidoglycan interpeptide bridge formation enzyme)
MESVLRRRGPAARAAAAIAHKYDMLTSSQYAVEIDQITETEWSDALETFADATIHQTWSAGRLQAGAQNLSHLVLRKDGELAGLAQVAIRKLPFVPCGVATVYWGPLWRRRGRDVSGEDLARLMSALKDEYASKRGCLLRVWPASFRDSAMDASDPTLEVLRAHGFRSHDESAPYRTLLLDLSPSEDDLRKNLDSKWRNQLKAAEKAELRLTEGSSDAMYETFTALLQEMVSRKKFETQVDYERYARIHRDLPPTLKMRLIICWQGDDPVAAGVFSAVGDTGTYVFGATANSGLRLNGSNLIQWTAIKWMKARGCRWYDLGGVDPAGNPGVYRFKKGIAGKNGREATHFGQFSLATRPISHLLDLGIERAATIRTTLRGFRKVQAPTVQNAPESHR